MMAQAIRGLRHHGTSLLTSQCALDDCTATSCYLLYGVATATLPLCQCGTTTALLLALQRVTGGPPPAAVHLVKCVDTTVQAMYCDQTMPYYRLNVCVLYRTRLASYR